MLSYEIDMRSGDMWSFWGGCWLFYRSRDSDEYMLGILSSEIQDRRVTSTVPLIFADPFKRKVERIELTRQEFFDDVLLHNPRPGFCIDDQRVLYLSFGGGGTGPLRGIVSASAGEMTEFGVGPAIVNLVNRQYGEAQLNMLVDSTNHCDHIALLLRLMNSRDQLRDFNSEVVRVGTPRGVRWHVLGSSIAVRQVRSVAQIFVGDSPVVRLQRAAAGIWNVADEYEGPPHLVKRAIFALAEDK